MRAVGDTHGCPGGESGGQHVREGLRGHLDIIANMAYLHPTFKGAKGAMPNNIRQMMAALQFLDTEAAGPAARVS